MDSIKNFLFNNQEKSNFLLKDSYCMEDEKDKKNLAENADRFLKLKEEIDFLIENWFDDDDKLMNDLEKKWRTFYNEIEENFFDLNWSIRDIYTHNFLTILSLLIKFWNEKIHSKLRNFIQNLDDKLLQSKIKEVFDQWKKEIKNQQFIKNLEKVSH